MEAEINNKTSSIIHNDNVIPLDQKLSALMLRGWTLLADVCPIETCQCPLMRSSAMKIYCPNCEAWVLDNAIQCRMDFVDLVPPKGKKISQTKQKEVKEIIEIQNKHQEETKHTDNKIVQIHKNKLKALTENLESETDATKIKWLLKNINLCIKNIKELNELNSIIN